MPQKDIGYLIKSVNDKLKTKADAELKEQKLTFTQSRVLAFLEGRGGQATQKEIERFLDVSHPTVVGIVSRMEQNGYLKCWTDGKDRRNKIVGLTPQAQAVGMNMEQSISVTEEMLLAPLSVQQREQLREMLLAILKNLDEVKS